MQLLAAPRQGRLEAYLGPLATLWNCAPGKQELPTLEQEYPACPLAQIAQAFGHSPDHGVALPAATSHCGYRSLPGRIVLPPLSAPEPGKLPKGVRYQAGPELTPRVSEVNVIGERAEEAVEKVERFLDSAVMATASRVRIVHGHGMGILKRAIHELLRTSPHVAKYYDAQQFEGGTGATIVEIRE